MSKTKINNRLENLFSDLSRQDGDDDLLHPTSAPLSWSWETDSSGIYTSCGSEVADATGLQPDDFIGSPLLSAHIVKADRAAFLNLIQKDEFPFEIDLQLEGLKGKRINTRYHVYKDPDKSGKGNLIHGYTQLIETPVVEAPVSENQVSAVDVSALDDLLKEIGDTVEENQKKQQAAAKTEVISAAEEVIKEPINEAIPAASEEVFVPEVKETDARAELVEEPTPTLEQEQPATPSEEEPVAPIVESETENKSEEPPKSERVVTGPLEAIQENPENDLNDLESELKKISRPARVLEPAMRGKRSSVPEFPKLSKTAPLGPLPLSQTNIADIDSTIRVKDLSGVALEGSDFKASQNVWTQQAMVSFAENVVVSSPASEETPAIMASPLNLRNQKTGVIEIVDSSPKRKWSEEDRLLVQEVSKQLGQALENALLYSTVEKELQERIKAEGLTERRNRDLATLNQMGQKLSHLVTRDEIFSITSSMIQKTLNTSNQLISVFNPESDTWTFPFCMVNGDSETIAPRKSREGYQEALLKSQAPLVINSNPTEILGNEVLDFPLRSPRSMLAVPLMVGNRGIGVISVFDFMSEKAFDQVQVELLSTISTQVATSLENTDLFEGINSAYETIEARERYQANVTKAVAALSERGMESINQVLEYLADAALCERTYYAEPFLEKEEGLIWSATSIYSKPQSTAQINNMLITRLVATEYPDWIKDLSSQGWHTVTLETAEGKEKEYLASQKINSLLLLSIPRDENRHGFIAFEDFSRTHIWKPEEIDILRIAAEGFTNTIIREELLKQLQSSLEETESLYTASHQLALSNSLQDMLASVIQGIHSQSINRGVLILFDYDEEDQIDRMVVEANYYSGAGTPPPPVGTEYLQSLYKSIFLAQNPIFYDDVADSQIEKNLQDILIRQNIHSMAVLPLWSANKQGGVLLLITIVKHRFAEAEIRALAPLVDQMATTIENLRLFESTEKALNETELLYKISSGVAKAVNFDELIRLVGENALPKDMTDLHLFIAASGSEKSDALEMIGSYNSEKGYTALGQNIPMNRFIFLDLTNPEPLSFTNIPKSRIGTGSLNYFSSMGWNSACFIPMLSGSTLIGLLAVSSPKPTELDKDEMHTLQIVASSISVAIERQRLLTQTQQRALELQAASEIARDTTSTLARDELLNRIVNLIKTRFNFYHTSIYLLDDTNTFAEIAEATGRAGMELKSRQHRVAVGSKSVIGVCTATGKPEIVNEISESPIFFPNPLLPETKSEMGIPLKISDRVIGVLDIHSDKPGAFTQSELTVFQILSDQISIAIENAQAYEISQRAYDEMRELDRVKNQFLANMSHELRTPLNSVIGFSRVILKGIDGPINDVQRQDISSIYSSGMHLLNLINEILDMSKIEAGKMELQLELLNISDVINSSITNAAGLVKDKPIKVVQQIEPNLPAVKMDEIRISQIITNLISNAVKFTETGSITVSAKRSQSPENKPEIMVTVSDTGIGIAPEDQAKLFQRFSQVDDSPTRKTGGTGLGLSICRSLIELHGGRIDLLSSEVGKGSTFYFTLPIEEPKAEIDIDQFTHENNLILSIDDDPQVIALYERYLEPGGYQVIAEIDPDAAVERAKQLKPMAITLDIMMPGKDGWQVMRTLKQDPETKDIPILICSILEEEEKGISMGASDYLVKPFVQDDLLKAIKRMNTDGNLREILVVDDDVDDLRLTQKMIENGGNFLVTTAENGKDALEILTNSVPDMIILDLFMPGLNGFDLLEILRADPRLNHIPILILTGADLTAEQQTQLSEFGKHLFTKGIVKENELLEYIKESLEKIKLQVNGKVK
jgi:signal transduction histidine kinase/CheY-like chemotaxis protein